MDGVPGDVAVPGDIGIRDALSATGDTVPVPGGAFYREPGELAVGIRTALPCGGNVGEADPAAGALRQGAKWPASSATA